MRSRTRCRPRATWWSGRACGCPSPSSRSACSRCPSTCSMRSRRRSKSGSFVNERQGLPSMIRYRPYTLSLAALLLTATLWSCAHSAGGKTSGARGPNAWRPPAHDPLNPTLAIVAGKPITRHDVDSVLALAPAAIREDYLADPDQYKQLVERIAQQQVLYLEALKAGTESEPSYRLALGNQRLSLLLQQFDQT